MKFRYFFLMLFSIAALLFALVIFHRAVTQRKFTPEDWANYPQERYKMIQSLENEYVLKGMKRADVYALLGETNEDFYYIGNDGHDALYYAIKYDDSDTVAEHNIVRPD